MEPFAEGSKMFRPYKHALSHLAFFTRFASVFGAAAIIAVYIIAVANHDIDPYRSYVSDASGDPPQSGLFGLCVVIMIVMGFPVMYLHHMRNQAAMEDAGIVATRLSWLALASGSLSCLGMAVVALNPLSHVRRDGQWVSDT
ncbi:DNA damage-regulated autophagy modulator protein 1-like [Amblyomma americanum]